MSILYSRKRHSYKSKTRRKKQVGGVLRLRWSDAAIAAQRTLARNRARQNEAKARDAARTAISVRKAIAARAPKTVNGVTRTPSTEEIKQSDRDLALDIMGITLVSQRDAINAELRSRAAREQLLQDPSKVSNLREIIGEQSKSNDSALRDFAANAVAKLTVKLNATEATTAVTTAATLKSITDIYKVAAANKLSDYQITNQNAHDLSVAQASLSAVLASIIPTLAATAKNIAKAQAAATRSAVTTLANTQKLQEATINSQLSDISKKVLEATTGRAAIVAARDASVTALAVNKSAANAAKAQEFMLDGSYQSFSIILAGLNSDLTGLNTNAGTKQTALETANTAVSNFKSTLSVIRDAHSTNMRIQLELNGIISKVEASITMQLEIIKGYKKAITDANTDIGTQATNKATAIGTAQTTIATALSRDVFPAYNTALKEYGKINTPRNDKVDNIARLEGLKVTPTPAPANKYNDSLTAADNARTEPFTTIGNIQTHLTTYTYETSITLGLEPQPTLSDASVQLTFLNVTKPTLENDAKTAFDGVKAKEDGPLDRITNIDGPALRDAKSNLDTAKGPYDAANSAVTSTQNGVQDSLTTIAQQATLIDTATREGTRQALNAFKGQCEYNRAKPRPPKLQKPTTRLSLVSAGKIIRNKESAKTQTDTTDVYSNLHDSTTGLYAKYEKFSGWLRKDSKGFNIFISPTNFLQRAQIDAALRQKHVPIADAVANRVRIESLLKILGLNITGLRKSVNLHISTKNTLTPIVPVGPADSTLLDAKKKDYSNTEATATALASDKSRLKTVKDEVSRLNNAALQRGAARLYAYAKKNSRNSPNGDRTWNDKRALVSSSARLSSFVAIKNTRLDASIAGSKVKNGKESKRDLQETQAISDALKSHNADKLTEGKLRDSKETIDKILGVRFDLKTASDFLKVSMDRIKLMSEIRNCRKEIDDTTRLKDNLVPPTNTLPTELRLNDISEKLLDAADKFKDASDKLGTKPVDLKTTNIADIALREQLRTDSRTRSEIIFASMRNTSRDAVRALRDGYKNAIAAYKNLSKDIHSRLSNKQRIIESQRQTVSIAGSKVKNGKESKRDLEDTQPISDALKSHNADKLTEGKLRDSKETIDKILGVRFDLKSASDFLKVSMDRIRLLFGIKALRQEIDAINRARDALQPPNNTPRSDLPNRLSEMADDLAAKEHAYHIAKSNLDSVNKAYTTAMNDTTAADKLKHMSIRDMIRNLFTTVVNRTSTRIDLVAKIVAFKLRESINKALKNGRKAAQDGLKNLTDASKAKAVGARDSINRLSGRLRESLSSRIKSLRDSLTALYAERADIAEKQRALKEALSERAKLEEHIRDLEDKLRNLDDSIRDTRARLNDPTLKDNRSRLEEILRDLRNKEKMRDDLRNKLDNALRERKRLDDEINRLRKEINALKNERNKPTVTPALFIPYIPPWVAPAAILAPLIIPPFIPGAVAGPSGVTPSSLPDDGSGATAGCAAGKLAGVKDGFTAGASAAKKQYDDWAKANPAEAASLSLQDTSQSTAERGESNTSQNNGATGLSGDGTDAELAVGGGEDTNLNATGPTGPQREEPTADTSAGPAPLPVAAAQFLVDRTPIDINSIPSPGVTPPAGKSSSYSRSYSDSFISCYKTAYRLQYVPGIDSYVPPVLGRAYQGYQGDSSGVGDTEQHQLGPAEAMSDESAAAVAPDAAAPDAVTGNPGPALPMTS